MLASFRNLALDMRQYDLDPGNYEITIKCRSSDRHLRYNYPYEMLKRSMELEASSMLLHPTAPASLLPSELTIGGLKIKIVREEAKS